MSDIEDVTVGLGSNVVCQLLESWGVSPAVCETFKVQDIDLNCLENITEMDIEALIPATKIKDRIRLRTGLNEYKKENKLLSTASLETESFNSDISLTSTEDCLASTRSPKLKREIEYDFQQIHPRCDIALFKNWPEFLKKAHPIFQQLKTVDKHVKLLETNVKEDTKDFIYFLALSYKLIPTFKVPVLNSSKRKIYKPSIVESMNAFILHVKNQADLRV